MQLFHSDWYVVTHHWDGSGNYMHALPFDNEKRGFLFDRSGKSDKE